MPTNTSAHEKWQNLYPPEESRWQDLNRGRDFTFPVLSLATLVIIFTSTTRLLKAGSWDEIASITAYEFLLPALPPMILTAIGLIFIFGKAKEVVSRIFQPSPEEKLSHLLRRKLLGTPPFPPPLDKIFKYPFIVLKEPSLENTHWARWFGGPAILVIHDGTAIYLERGNKFSRVVGPGEPMPLLERNERIVRVVDLRPQVKTDTVRPWTKDGIHIALDLRVEVQVNAGPKALEKSSKLRYPFDPLAVKAVVEYSCAKANPDGTLYEAPWLDGAWGSITGAINAFVAGHSLDELFLAPQSEPPTHLNQQHNVTVENVEQLLSKRISEKVTTDIQADLQRNGIKALNIQITKVAIPDEIQALRTKYWESIRDILSAQRNSRAEAERIRIREQAHADAQRTILMAITKKLENIDADNMTEPLILSLSGLLDHGLDDPLIRPWIANESFTVLQKMRKLLKEKF